MFFHIIPNHILETIITEVSEGQKYERLRKLLQQLMEDRSRNRNLWLSMASTTPYESGSQGLAQEWSLGGRWDCLEQDHCPLPFPKHPARGSCQG